MNKDVMFSSATDLWETPQSFFDALNEEFGFETDVATGRRAKTSCIGAWRTAFCRDKWFLKEWRIYEKKGNRAGAAVLCRL